jgi:hypothetical protein
MFELTTKEKEMGQRDFEKKRLNEQGGEEKGGCGGRRGIHPEEHNPTTIYIVLWCSIID